MFEVLATEIVSSLKNQHRLELRCTHSKQIAAVKLGIKDMSKKNATTQEIVWDRGRPARNEREARNGLEKLHALTARCRHDARGLSNSTRR
jgi:hypothetical protein